MGKRGRAKKKPITKKKGKIKRKLTSASPVVTDDDMDYKPTSRPQGSSPSRSNAKTRARNNRTKTTSSSMPSRTTRSMKAFERQLLQIQLLASLDDDEFEKSRSEDRFEEQIQHEQDEQHSQEEQNNQYQSVEQQNQSDASGDSDATEVYSVSSDQDDDQKEEQPKVPDAPSLSTTVEPKKTQRRSIPIATSTKVNHNLSENSDDDLISKRRPIIIRKKRKQKTSSSSSSTDEETSSKRINRPPTPTFRKTDAKKSKEKKKVDAEVILDEDHHPHSDVEKMNETDLAKKTERKMLNDEDLAQVTKKALDEEKQRVKRIQERQSQLASLTEMLEESQFNGDLSSQPNKTAQDSTPKLTFEFDMKTSKPMISVHEDLVAKMKPHQMEGTIFLWDNVYESSTLVKSGHPGTGCILAHHMGLGKTFQLISFVHTVFKHCDLTNARTCLILCPVNVISNWASEFAYWLSSLRPTIKVHQFSLFKTKAARWERLEKWNERGGVMLMGYEIYRRLSNDSDYNFFLLDPGPDIIVCDEGHVLKNANAGISKALNKIRTKRRIILTGTPLQNNLKEYYYMVNFVKPHLLGTFREFKNQFIDPIRGGQHKDSNIYAVQLMKRRAFALHERLKHCTHRRDFNVLRKYLPDKYEYVIKIYMGDLQKQLYNKYLKIQNIDPTAGLNAVKLFSDYQYLMKIWTHPWLLRPHFIDRWKKRQKRGETEADKIDPFFNDITGVSDDEVAADEENNKKSTSKKKLSPKKQKGKESASKLIQEEDDDDGHSSSHSSSSTSEFLSLFNNTNWKRSSESNSRSLQTTNFDPCQRAMQDEWWFPFFDETAEFDLSLSGKITFLKTLLDECELIGDKVLLFSRSLFSLTYLEQFLKQWDASATGKKVQSDDFDAKVQANGRWKFGIDYFRIDGSTDIATRTNYIDKFNEPINIRSRLFIVSTMAGGIGINLTGSNRVVIFDCSWNPSSDLQALFRSYRLGQKKSTYVYRLLSKGSMEERIYFRQVNKQAMAQRVVDAQQLARHFTESELRELYAFKPEDNEGPENVSKPLRSDALLKKCVEKHSNLVQNILEHDSLLEDHVEEQLTREEKFFAMKELEEEERLAEYQSAVAKTLATMSHNNTANHNSNSANNPNNNNNQNGNTVSDSNESKADRKVVNLTTVNSYNPYQTAAPICAQARAAMSTAQEARGLERLTELLFANGSSPIDDLTKTDSTNSHILSDLPYSKKDLEELDIDEEDLDPRTKKEKQKALMQEQRALMKLYNDKRKLLRAPKAQKIVKSKKLPSIDTSIVSNPYQFMPIVVNPFDLPPSMQKLPD